jgi:transposase
MSTTTTGGKAQSQSPEVRAPRRTFPSKYKLAIIAQIDAAEGRSAVGEILRREGLHSSLVSDWRKQRDRGALESMSKTRRGPKSKDPLQSQNEALRKRVKDLEEQLGTAEEIIAAQGKVSALLQQMPAKRAETK